MPQHSGTLRPATAYRARSTREVAPVDPLRHAQDRDAVVARRLVDLARSTPLDAEDLSAHMLRVVGAMAEVAPGLEVGILLVHEDGRPTAVTARSPRLAALFRIQVTRGGPTIQCLRTGEPVSVVDLDDDPRWAAFRRLAQRLGVSQVHALPMRDQGEVLGALTLVAPQHSIGATESDLEFAQAIADLAAFSIAQQRALAGADVETRQLREALASRVAIEQAKGMLAAHCRTDVGTAFEAMRSYSRRNRLRLLDTAIALRDGSLTPDDLLEAGPAGRVHDRANLRPNRS